MAAGTFSAVETVVERVQLTLNDKAGKWLTSDEYQSFVDDCIVEDQSSYTFTRRGTGVWIADGAWGGKPFVLSPANETLPFTVAADCTYKFTCWGTVRQATGTADTTSSYSCTGLRIAFNQVMSDLCYYLAQHRSLVIAESSGVSPDTIARHFMHMASVWKD